jgi:hypothetical protein
VLKETHMIGNKKPICQPDGNGYPAMKPDGDG